MAIYPCKPVCQVTSSDFFFSGLVNEASTENPLGVGGSFGDVTNFPGINTHGLTTSRADFAPGGYIPVHILIGFLSTTNVLYSKVLKASELAVIPRGLVHSVSNAGPGKASMLAIYNSQLPGIPLIPNNLFASNPTIPNDILAKNFQVSEATIAGIKSKFGT
ncbi:hypothetical protein MKW98_006209 [Papaver atlanticum]|uniref:Germin-like protein n=1 Tax=Papaver atlanticum TaxID=357466 RepID=A0AAD4TE48_9MAGN|nr:hypothetical protein MKW98_006209 [Papaver atlanticum]